VDAHGAMVMAQGQLSREKMQSILENPEGSDLIDEKAKALLKLAAKMTKESHKVTAEDIETLRGKDFSDDVILEAIHVIAFFNYLDRMADATGAPVENLQEMMANMA
jgi:uncharacterized peroxidase-related enzyme